MKRLLAGIFLLTALGAAAAPPEFQEYQLVSTCNIFNSKRIAPPPKKIITQKVTPPAKPKPKTLVLLGVILKGEEASATFNADGGLVRLAVDGLYSQLKLIAITSKSVTLQQEQEEILLLIGEALIEGEDKVWQKTSADRPTISGKAIAETAEKQAEQDRENVQKAQQDADILKRLIERRKRQLGQ